MESTKQMNMDFCCKQLAWIRHRDIHILTVGSYTYTTDQRFQATYNKDLGESTLEIRWASIRDAGLYECQISSQPVRSLFVHLDVVGENNTKEDPNFDSEFD